jgi:hypothetical protein
MGSTVELIHTSWLVFTQYYAIGRVVECVTPTAASTTAEYDAAIVELYNPNLFSNLPHRGVAHIRSPQPQPLLSTLFGGVSGAVGPAAIVGSLTAYGGPAGIWKNSWLVQPSGMISQGDSGGVLLRDADQTVVGMIVGGSRVPNSTRYMAQYAHDMESLASDVLKPRGYQIA